MRGLNRVGISTAAITLLASSAVGLATEAAASGQVPISSSPRNCDFSRIQTAIQVPRALDGHGTAVFHTSGSTVVADVTIGIPSQPGAHYDVGLIEGPRPSSATCGPGDPGTMYTGVDLDGTGLASITITAPLRQGATSAWVTVSRPAEHNWAPAEQYTSEYMAPI